MIDLNNFGKGCNPQKLDLRDYRLETIAGNYNLQTEFSVRDKIIKVKSQNGSSSCVGQSFSYYAEVLNTIETGQKIQLSARDIYSKIFQPEGGAYLRDACKILIKEGIATESAAASYDQGISPSEAFMRQRSDITSEEQAEGMLYWAKNYYSWDTLNWEMFKKAIQIGKGAVIGAWGNNPCWQDAILEVPVSKWVCPWAHAIYLTGFVKINGKEYLEGINSWEEKYGDKGFCYMPREYIESGLIFNCFTVIDRNNQEYEQIINSLLKVKFAIMNLATEIKNKLTK